VIDLFDEIAVERLPAHLTERHQLEQHRAEQEQHDREREEARERLARFGEDLEAGLRERAETLGDDDRAQIEQDISTLHGPYSPRAWTLRNAMTAPATEADAVAARDGAE
jgi:hypothetical protein